MGYLTAKRIGGHLIFRSDNIVDSKEVEVLRQDGNIIRKVAVIPIDFNVSNDTISKYADKMCLKYGVYEDINNINNIVKEIAK